ncbi:phosphoribosyltransferase family protein [Aliarcobacter thereius]|uniref:Ribose-phosphate pyrophosphokinase n=1 Tax=Aliarcobacter thereius LMG 24486 TaxID=1032240 RepID=A0A1C7WQT3_9BACT|nr:phosphoribosyltransferase family protein [Aliarcobacter thereius]OCL91148.1 ribose-phosphate pyrophosphokinase [Aliarcobacter thereius]OCL95999.1 ribose-phosphate pyrophosphokinase [Aliarcobacter thereius LMG 24486]TLS94628.1 ABC transporter [Aliarcobacter thereius]HJE02403.1 ABC transporter [Aliarcobacter thereius]
MSLDNIYFKNREVAAYKLLDVLPLDSMKLEKWIVVACSYGGYEIAKIVAEALNSEYDLLFNEKIYAPNNEECEIAVVTELEEVLIHEELVKSFDIELDLIYLKSKDIFETTIKPKIHKFRAGEKLTYLKGKNVLIVDEDINVGLVMMACIKTIINQGVKSISVATPLLSTASIQAIDAITDDLYYVKKLDHYIEADFYYDSLEKLSFEDIEELKKEG